MTGIGGSYEPQVGAGGAPQLGGVSPEALGAGVGAAIAGFGRELDSEAARAHKIETEQDRNRQWLGFNADFAKAKQENSAYFRDRQTTSPATAAPDAQADFNERVSNILPSDPRVLERAQATIAEHRADLDNSLDIWHRGQQVAQATLAFHQTGNSLLNGLYNSWSPKDMAGAIGQYDAMVDGTSGLDPTAKEKAKLAFHGDAVESSAKGLIAGGQLETAGTLLSSTMARDTLDPDKMAALGHELQVAVRTRDAQAKTAYNLAKGQAGEAAELVMKRVEAGEIVPDAEMQAVQANAATYGLDAKVYDLGTLRAKAALNQETKPWLPAQYVDEQNRLRALIAAGKATPADQVRLHQLEKIAPERIREIEKDPAAFAAANGAPPPALDPSSTASWQARGAWADGLGKQMGRPVPLLSPAEAQPLVDTVAHGSLADKMGVAGQILHAGPYARRLLDQVAPTNPGFRGAISLAANNDGGQSMRDAIEGAEALKANPGVLKPEKDPITNKAGPGHETLFNAWAGSAISQLPPEYRAALLYNATNIYASRATRQGWTVFHPNEFAKSIDYALGARDVAGGKQGGVGRWQGAPIVLPRGMTQAQFDTKLSRSPGPAWLAASTNPGDPAWVGDPQGGRAMYSGELRGLVPTMVRDGVYALRQGNSYVTTRTGKRFEFDVRKLP